MTQPGKESKVAKYIRAIVQQSEDVHSSEHAYRSALQELVKAIIAEALTTNEPVKTGGKKPDILVRSKSNVKIGYIETKNIGADLDSIEKNEQVSGYREEFSNFILTDYLEFRLYLQGCEINRVRLADNVGDGKMEPEPDKQKKQKLIALLTEFGDSRDARNDVPSAEKLAQMLAGKTKKLRRVVSSAMLDKNRALISLYKSFCDKLMPGLSESEFTDVYSQTAVYGLFMARLQAEEKCEVSGFSRAKAGRFLPAHPELFSGFFGQFVDFEITEPISTVVDDIAEYLRDISVEQVLLDFIRNDGGEEPFVHFYETFLKHYNPKERKAKGVYYTPFEAVNFIVRTVDGVLKERFSLQGGMACHEKMKSGCHRVQILDPACGTGTFLSEVIKHIRESVSSGSWDSYALKHLFPRVHGFENMMSAYIISHFRFALEMGAPLMQKLAAQKGRINVLLTDTMDFGEKGDRQTGLGWLDEESKLAEKVKNKKQLMVILGNPPYNIHSQNRGPHIQSLIQDYKEGLNEKKLNLDNDYVKFIRISEWLIDGRPKDFGDRGKGAGVLAMICDNSFLDAVTFRRMREHLRQTFDRIYILNLHGKSRTAVPGASMVVDENIFDITQGVCIFIMVRNGEKNKTFIQDKGVWKLESQEALADVCYAEHKSSRKDKCGFLLGPILKEEDWKKLPASEPGHFFVPKDLSLSKEYDSGISIPALLPVYISGIQTKRDPLTVRFSSDDLDLVLEDMVNEELSDEAIRVKYKLPMDGRDWRLPWARKDAKSYFQNSGEKKQEALERYYYRPFDMRVTYYTGKTKGFVAYPRHKVMQHIVRRENTVLIAPKICKGDAGFEHGLVSRTIIDISAGDRYSGSGTYCFPLYLYEEMQGQVEKHANINSCMAEKIAKAANLCYANEGENSMSPLDILDYVYAVMHNPHYRTRYAEFLKIDFPKIPLPNGKEHFRNVAKIGSVLRELHLMDEIAKHDIAFNGNNNIVEKIKVEQQGNALRIKINEKSSFDNVSPQAWEFSIGGYLPAQKYLKDRKGRALSYDEQQHYICVLAALAETSRIMEEMPPLSK